LLLRCRHRQLGDIDSGGSGVCGGLALANIEKFRGWQFECLAANCQQFLKVHSAQPTDYGPIPNGCAVSKRLAHFNNSHGKLLKYKFRPHTRRQKGFPSDAL